MLTNETNRAVTVTVRSTMYLDHTRNHLSRAHERTNAYAIIDANVVQFCTQQTLANQLIKLICFNIFHFTVSNIFTIFVNLKCNLVNLVSHLLVRSVYNNASDVLSDTNQKHDNVSAPAFSINE